MNKGITHTYFKKAACCLVFLFSFLFSFSSVYKDHHVHLNVADETSIDGDQLDYFEFSLTAHGHLSELPENPSESENSSDVENEKENENETDDEKDELAGHHNFDDILLDVYSQKEKSQLTSDFFKQGTVVPFYILFHSWKSFLA